MLIEIYFKGGPRNRNTEKAERLTPATIISDLEAWQTADSPPGYYRLIDTYAAPEAVVRAIYEWNDMKPGKAKNG